MADEKKDSSWSFHVDEVAVSEDAPKKTSERKIPVEKRIRIDQASIYRNAPQSGGLGIEIVPRKRPEREISVAEKKKALDPEERYAGFAIRAQAMFIDGVFMAALFFAFSILIKKFLPHFIQNPALFQIVIIVFSGIVYLGSIIIPLATTGMTLGKKMSGIQLINSDGTNIGLFNVFLREVIGKTISSILVFGWFLPLFRKNKKALHDYLCKTNVIIIS